MRLELTGAQVDSVVRQAAGAGTAATVLAGVQGAGLERLQAIWTPQKEGRLSRSLVHGLMILALLPSDGSYMGNAQVAKALGMNPSTAHRYVGTLVELGLVERDPVTRKYRIGAISGDRSE